jgi:hypothetical protein
VPRKTLSNRILRTPSRITKVLNSQKLTILEEEVIIRYILDLDSRAFPPRRSTIEDIANRILADYNKEHIRKN